MNSVIVIYPLKALLFGPGVYEVVLEMNPVVWLRSFWVLRPHKACFSRPRRVCRALAWVPSLTHLLGIREARSVSCVGFTRTGSGSGGLQGCPLWGECSSCPMLDKGRFQEAPEGPAAAQNWDKTDDVCACVRAHLRKGKKPAAQQRLGQGGVRNLSAAPKVSAAGGRRCSRLTAAVPLRPGERPLVEQAVPLQPTGPTRSRSPRCSPWRSPRWSRWMWPGGGCGPWRAPAGAGPGPELQPVERSPRRSRGSGGSCRPPVGDPCWSSLLLGDGWTPWYGAMWDLFLKSCCLRAAPAGSVREGRHPVGGTPRGAGAESDREGAVMECHRLDRCPHSPVPLCCWGVYLDEGGWGGAGGRRVVLVCF